MMRNILLFHCLGPNQSPARAGHHTDKPAHARVGALRGVAGSGAAHLSCMRVLQMDFRDDVLWRQIVLSWYYNWIF